MRLYHPPALLRADELNRHARMYLAGILDIGGGCHSYMDLAGIHGIRRGCHSRVYLAGIHGIRGGCHSRVYYAGIQNQAKSLSGHVIWIPATTTRG